MGKNKGKKGKRTEYARLQSIMRKLENDLAKQAAKEASESRKKEKEDVKNGDKTDL